MWLAKRAALPATDHSGIRRVAFLGNESASPGLHEERLDVSCHSAIPCHYNAACFPDPTRVTLLHGGRAAGGEINRPPAAPHIPRRSCAQNRIGDTYLLLDSRALAKRQGCYLALVRGGMSKRACGYG